MKILITGGTGFIGTNLVKSLLNEKHDLFLVTREGSNYSNIGMMKSHCNIIKTDILEFKKLKLDVYKRTKQVDTVIHLLSYGVTEKEFDLNVGIRTNLLGTSNILKLAVELKSSKFINTGSCFEYSESKKAYKETDSIAPKTMYGAIKAAQTVLVSSFAEVNSLKTITLRPFTPYGAYENPNRFIPTLLANAMKRKDMYFSNPNSVRDFIFIEDVVEAYKKALIFGSENISEIFNIGSGKQFSLYEITQILQKILNLNLDKFIHWRNVIDTRKVDYKIWKCSNIKAKRLLNWHPKNTIQQGLIKTMESMKS